MVQGGNIWGEMGKKSRKEASRFWSMVGNLSFELIVGFLVGCGWDVGEDSKKFISSIKGRCFKEAA